MRSVSVIALAAAVLGAGAAGASSRSPIGFGPGPKVCGSGGSQTIESSGAARVYSLHGTAYACLNPSGKSYKLGSEKLCIGVSQAGPFALAGKVVGYGLKSCGVDDSSEQVVVRSLASGQILRNEAAASELLVEQEGGIRSLVVKPDDSVAWIDDEMSLGNRRRVIQVRKVDKRGDTLLDSGLEVAPASLKLNGSQLTWRHGGKLRSATLR